MVLCLLVLQDAEGHLNNIVLVEDNNVVKEDNDPLVDLFSSDLDPFKPGILSKLILFIFLHLLYHLPFLDFIYRVSHETWQMVER